MPRPGELRELGSEGVKVHPKLRMICNGNVTVNTLRADHAGCLAVRDVAATRVVPRLRGSEATPRPSFTLGERVPRPFRKRKLTRVPDEVEVNLFVTLTDDAAVWSGRSQGVFSATSGNLRTATRRLDELEDLLGSPEVQFVEPGQPLQAPTPAIASGDPDAPHPDLRRFGSVERHGDGRGVLIGIIDVQGFDFAHPDFLNPDGTTRWERIWDQGGGARPSPRQQTPGRRGFDYGAEFRRKHMNAAIRDATALGIPAQEIERQSQMVPASHGTHVASIAAGNVGVCRGARLAGVLIALSEDELDRRSSFYDSTRVAEAVEYLLDLARELGDLPLSINISLGTNGHAHDASSALSRWIDSAVSQGGIAVTVAAGNAGQESPLFEGDVGFVMGRVHASGTIPGPGLSRDLRLRVVGNGIVDLSENELEIWHPAQDRIRVSVKPPGADWLRSVGPGQYIENHQLEDGSYVSVYNELYHHANGENFIAVYLSPLLSAEGIVGVRAGEWIVRLEGEEIHDGSFHAWIERDDPRPLGPIGDRQAWRFPSYFSPGSFVDDSTVSSLACGLRVLSVANLDEAADRINPTSSQGPTRDGRPKPDVAAPGTGVVAARGYDPDRRWVAMSGTSMAAPFVCGVAGLMLAVEPRLTAAQINGILRRTARPLPGADFRWRNDAGFGRIDPEACLEEAAALRMRSQVTP